MYREFDKESKTTGKPRLLTAIATAAGQYLLKQGYDIPVLCKWLDMVNIMSYVCKNRSIFTKYSKDFFIFKDLYGAWYNKIGHHSALYHSKEETGQDRELNTV
jgi:GH18 family chitinase